LANGGAVPPVLISIDSIIVHCVDNEIGLEERVVSLRVRQMRRVDLWTVIGIRREVARGGALCNSWHGKKECREERERKKNPQAFDHDQKPTV
jgi:hypothetical protein